MLFLLSMGKDGHGERRGGLRMGEWRRASECRSFSFPRCVCQCTRRPSTEIFFNAVRGSGLRHLRGVAQGIQHRRRRKQSQRGGGRGGETPGEGGAERGGAVEEGGRRWASAQRVRAVMSVTEKVGMVSRVSGPVGYAGMCGGDGCNGGRRTAMMTSRAVAVRRGDLAW